MQYKKAVDIWTLTDEEISKLQPGQWVYAGDPSTKGRFYGRTSMTIVIAWLERAKGRYASYQRALSNYAKSLKEKQQLI